MEGNGEGMVAVVQGLHDAGLAVTLMSRRSATTRRQVAKVMGIRNQCLPQTKSSVETNTHNGYDRMKSHTGVQICDGRYASSYQLAHCRLSPTSPPVSLSEFPPQRTQPNRTQGNFEIGGYGSGEVTSDPIRTQYSFISRLRWADRRSAEFSGAACQTDPFAHSLRRYSTFLPSRSISADLIERLIKHTQSKNVRKPSKLSKSMRSIPKDETDEQTSRHDNKRAKNIQTYTRTKNNDGSNENINKDCNARRERSYRLSFSGDRRHRKNKGSPINTTYDYLKGNSSLYRKRNDRFTDVRYLDNLAKYIKDTLQQFCDDRPVICPKIQSRFNQHRKNCHHDQSSFESNETDDQVAPSSSARLSIPSSQVTSGTCTKNCPKGRKICEICRKPLACPCLQTLRTEAGTSSPSLHMQSKYCQCLPDDIAPERRRDATCLCKLAANAEDAVDAEDAEGFDQKINVEVSAWIKELPVKVDDTPENIAVRERMGKELAAVLKNLPQDESFNDNVMIEAIKCLDKLPIWLPDTKAASDAFKDSMAKKLLERLKQTPERPDKFADIIKDWVNGIDFKEKVNTDKIAEDFIGKLQPIALNRPSSNSEYAIKLKEAIHSMLEELPVNTKDDKQRTLNELADNLIEKLVSLPKDAVKPEDMAQPVNEFLNIINNWLDDEAFRDYPFMKNSKAVEDFAKKLRELQAQGVGREELRKVIQDFLKNIVGITDPDVLEKLTNKLLAEILGEEIIEPKNRQEEVEKIYKEIYIWMKNRPEVSHLDQEKIKELSRELANEIYDKRSTGGEEINNVEWLKRKLSDIGEGETAQENRRKRKLVLNAIESFLADAVTDLPSEIREELKEKLADMLIKNVDEIINYEVEDDLLDDETDRLINKLFEGVRNIYVPDSPDPPKVRKTLRDEIDNILDDTSININNKDALKTNLITTLADGVLKRVDKNEIKKDVTDQLCTANIPQEKAKNITEKLLKKAEGLALAIKSQDSKISNTMKLSRAEPSSLKKSADYHKEIDTFVPDDVLKLDNNRRGSSAANGGKEERRSTRKAATDIYSRGKSTKQYDEPLSEELLEQLKTFNIDPNDKEAVERYNAALQEAKQEKGPLDKLMASLDRYSNLPKVPRKPKPKVVTSPDESMSPRPSYSKSVKKEFIESPIGIKEPPISSDKVGRLKAKTHIKSEPNDLSEIVAQKTGLSKRQPLDSQAKQELKKMLQGDIENALNKVKTKINDRDELEPKLLTTILDQVEEGDIEDVRDDVYRHLRNANISADEAKPITNNLLGKTKDLSKVVALKTKAGSSKSQPLDSKAKQEVKQSLKGDIDKALEKIKTKIYDKADLESNLLNTILDQIERGDIEGVTDDVYRLLRNANIPPEEAENITNKLLNKAKDLSQGLAQKIIDASSKSRPLDSITKQEMKQSLKADIQKGLDKVKTKIDDREYLESNLLNTILGQVEGGDVEGVRDDIYKLLRNANIPQEQAKDITNKILGKGKDLTKTFTQRMMSSSRSDYEDTLKPGKAYAQKRRPSDSSKDTYSKRDTSTKQKDQLRASIISDVSDVIDGAPLPLSSRTKNGLKTKLSDALINGMNPPYNTEDFKSKVLNILSEESIKLHGDRKPKAADKFSQMEERRRDTTGKTNMRYESLLQEISQALDNALTRIPKNKVNRLKNKLADIVLKNISSDINNVRLKILEVLTRETHLHKGAISDMSSDIIERIIDVLKDSEIVNKRRAKKMIYSLQINGRKRDNVSEDDKRAKRKKNGSLTSEDDGPINKSKSTGKHNYSNLSRSISDYVDYTIAKEHIKIPQHKIHEIKQQLDNVSPEDILAMIRGDEAIKKKILDILINEIKLTESDTNELINGIIQRFNEGNDSQYSATPSQMQDMKGYLKGEILDLLQKYNVKFNQEGSLKSGSTPPALRGEAAFSSTPRDGIESPQILNEPSLSTVYDDDEFSDSPLKTSDRNNSGECYFDKILDIVNNWVEELPVDINDENIRNTIVKNLATDIVERKKYLQLNPDAKSSAKEELECLKYQVFRWMNHLFDDGDLSALTPKIAELRDRINAIDVPMFNKSSKRQSGKRNSNGKESSSDTFKDKFDEWIKSLPVKFKNAEEKQQYENLISELFSKLIELGPQASAQAIRNEINKFLQKAPLDPSKDIDFDEKIEELTRILQTSDPSKMNAASFESKTGYKQPPNLLYDFIENWCDSLPFDDSLSQDDIKNIKHSLANKILQKICQLNLNSEILNDDFLYEDVLRDEIDNLLSEIRNYIPIDDEQLAEIKDVVVNKIKEAKQKTQNELAGQMYKQQLRDAISRSIPPGIDLSSEDQTSLEVLKDAVADAFISLNYTYGNDELRNKLKKKIADEVMKFCNNYLQRHPTTPLCSNKLNQDLYTVLKAVSLPNDESMRSEVEHVRMKEVITDWVRCLPLAEQTPTGQSTLNKMISVLSKRLHELENAGELSDSDYTEQMKKETKKWLQKLPMLGGKDSIEHYITDLIDRLKSTEDSRKFDASTRLQLDASDTCLGPCHYTVKERPQPPEPCTDTCMDPPQCPSSLTREDREHLNRIRERVQQARSKLAKRPCRDTSPSPCIDTGSQTEIRNYGSMKSVPSVCPGHLQRPYKSATNRLRESPSCQIPCGTPKSATPQSRQNRRRTGGASPCVDSLSPCNGSYNDVQPQIIVKEYYWDSAGNSNHQIPCRTPCDTYRGSREPRSPCSQPSPTCRGQYSQPQTCPQSPQMSSSDQENRRPSTSRYYKERVTRLGSFDDMRSPNMKDKKSENFDWSSVRFPEDDDFWGHCNRHLILSDDDFGPYSRERERKEERSKCRCRERVLSNCAAKRRNRFCASCNPSNHNTSKHSAKCSANVVQCPHPSYLYFRK